MLARLETLRGKCRALAKNGRSAVEEIRNDPALKKEIEEVYLHYFGRRVTGCSNCLWDALLELTFTLKKEQAKMKTDKFILKRGKILHDVVNLDAGKDATRDNMTEELALYHLYTNPRNAQFFEALPDDWQKQAAAYGKKYEAAKLEAAEIDGNVEADKVLNDANDEATKILDKAKADADKVLGDREAALAGREAKVIALATAVLELGTDGNEEAYNAVIALAREIIPADNDGDGDGGSGEPGTEVALKDGTIVTLREGVGYNADGTVAKRGTYETADGGKLIVANKGAARIEAPAPANNDGDGGSGE